MARYKLRKKYQRKINQIIKEIKPNLLYSEVNQIKSIWSKSSNTLWVILEIKDKKLNISSNRIYEYIPVKGLQGLLVPNHNSEINKFIHGVD